MRRHEFLTDRMWRYYGHLQTTVYLIGVLAMLLAADVSSGTCLLLPGNLQLKSCSLVSLLDNLRFPSLLDSPETNNQ